MPRLPGYRNRVWTRLAAFLLAAALMPGAGFSSPDNRILVVSASGVRPLEIAVAGLREGLGQTSASFIDLKSPTASAELSETLRVAAPRIIVTVGMEALKVVVSQHSSAAIFATMVLRSDAAAILAEASGERRVAALYLDVPPAEIGAELKILFPGKHRIGAIRNPARDRDPQWQARLRQQGFAVEMKECSRPEELLKSFLSLKRKVDFVLLSPDSSLYNEATVKPVILASLENQLPIIGFSASFVRAGAAIGVYPEFQDVGLQAADALRRYLTAPSILNDEMPRKLTVGVNPQVLRLLGLEPESAAGHMIVAIK